LSGRWVIKMVKFERRRYLAFKLYPEKKEVKKNSLAREIWTSLISLFGEKAAADTNFWLVDYDEEKCIGIARCTNRTVEILRSAIALLSSVDSIRISVKTLKISGSLRKLRKKYLLR